MADFHSISNVRVNGGYFYLILPGVAFHAECQKDGSFHFLQQFVGDAADPVSHARFVYRSNLVCDKFGIFRQTGCSGFERTF